MHTAKAYYCQMLWVPAGELASVRRPCLLITGEGARGRSLPVRHVRQWWLVEHGVRHTGEMALYSATRTGLVETVQMLVAAGAAIDHARRDGSAPLFLVS